MDELLLRISQPISQNPFTLFGLFIFICFFYGVYAFVREIICTNVCPYGILQGVMVVKDTMQVANNYQLGEPRAR